MSAPRSEAHPVAGVQSNSLSSAIYEGAVHHARLDRSGYAFRYRLQLLDLDLDELAELPRLLRPFALEGPGLFSFRRADYLGDPALPLIRAVRDLVEERLGFRPLGGVRLVTQVRTLGFVFNPVSFYFCHDEAGEPVAIAAEITNTPWGERHTYVLDARGGGEVVADFSKEFHVSPFQGMEQDYSWRFCLGDELRVEMTSHEWGRAVFRAELHARRRVLSGRALLGCLVRFPFQTLRVPLAIYWHAALLFLRRAPFHEHPRRREGARSSAN